MKKFLLYLIEKILFNFLCRLVPQKKDLLLFGSGFKRFSGNSKFLFEHYSNTNIEYESYWISEDKNEARQIREMGFKCSYKWNLKTVFLVLRAKVIIISHNIKDVFPFITRRTSVINLWHGTPIKTIGFDSKKERVWIDKYIQEKRVLPYEKWDYFITASENLNDIFSKAMKLEESKIKGLGLPRTQIIYNYLNDKKNQNEIDNRFDEVYKVDSKLKILYTPTFRNDETSTLKIKETLLYINQNIKKENNAVLLFKPHPLDKEIFDMTFFNTLENIIDVSSYDTQELLCVSDVLITDYSSIMFDFMITDKPIISYIFDLNNYINQNGDLYFSFERLKTNIAKNKEELLGFILNKNELRNEYDPYEFNMMNSCERIESFINELNN
ncbi:CDP-glycerol glycerophosphotransferase family protein [uncultured Aquimarina sp.]|uniref:CDP-glycerol glycerophosphotransferase family protein n=1 Tax=uncultured Aquimarina sp. TaxID=575652 RepID=UPI00262C6595|nr:CDP-glycerol glycerophosphotransferase family protein [uncultured Aquimarina sp.]